MTEQKKQEFNLTADYYFGKKATGTMEVIVVDEEAGKYALAFKMYDPETGQEIQRVHPQDPSKKLVHTIVPVDLFTLRQKKESYFAMADGIQKIMDDLKLHPLPAEKVMAQINESVNNSEEDNQEG